MKMMVTVTREMQVQTILKVLTESLRSSSRYSILANMPKPVNFKTSFLQLFASHTSSSILRALATTLSGQA